MLGLGHRDVNEDYELGGLLGQGAYAVVCQCRNRKTGQQYACKTILKSKLKRKADVEDIRREVQILMVRFTHFMGNFIRKKTKRSGTFLYRKTPIFFICS